MQDSKSQVFARKIIYPVFHACAYFPNFTLNIISPNLRENVKKE